jgi:hypothetical protein
VGPRRPLCTTPGADSESWGERQQRLARSTLNVVKGNLHRDSESAPLSCTSGEITRLRSTLGDLDTLPLAALLRELGVVLYNRDIVRWRALTDISDEMLDGATLAARSRLVARVTGDNEAATTGQDDHQAAVNGSARPSRGRSNHDVGTVQTVGPSIAQGPTGPGVREDQAPVRHAADVIPAGASDRPPRRDRGTAGAATNGANHHASEQPPRGRQHADRAQSADDSRRERTATPRVVAGNGARSHVGPGPATSDKRHYVNSTGNNILD